MGGAHFLAKRWQLGPSRPLGYPREGCQSQRLLATSSMVVNTLGAAAMAAAFSHPKSDILQTTRHPQPLWHISYHVLCCSAIFCKLFRRQDLAINGTCCLNQ